MKAQSYVRVCFVLISSLFSLYFFVSCLCAAAFASLTDHQRIASADSAQPPPSRAVRVASTHCFCPAVHLSAPLSSLFSPSSPSPAAATSFSSISTWSADSFTRRNVEACLLQECAATKAPIAAIVLVNASHSSSSELHP